MIEDILSIFLYSKNVFIRCLHCLKCLRQFLITSTVPSCQDLSQCNFVNSVENAIKHSRFVTKSMHNWCVKCYIIASEVIEKLAKFFRGYFFGMPRCVPCEPSKTGPLYICNICSFC